jgi:transposase
MEKAADENYDDFIEVEEDYQISAIEAYVAKQIKLKDLMASLGHKRTQTLRKVKCFKAEGAKGLKSKKIGLSNNSLNREFRVQVIELVKEHYPDFGPVFAAEKLSERQGISIKASTLRRWMIDEGLWQTRFDRQPKVYSPRMRRECRGELIQVDGSYHRWFEKRGPEACLIAFIDDATSQIMHLRMVDHESSFNYMRCLKWYIEQYGRPLALYSDKHSIFRATNTDASGNRNATQFSRACNGRF